MQSSGSPAALPPLPMTNGSSEDPRSPAMDSAATPTAVTSCSSNSSVGSAHASSGPPLPAPPAPYLTITNPAMTAAVLSQQPLIIPTGAQFLTIPVSLATLPGSNQIPVFATSTGQLVLANLASVPTTAANHGAGPSPFAVSPAPFAAQNAQLARSGLPALPQLPPVGAPNSTLSDGHEVDIDRDMELKEEEVDEEEGEEEEEEEGAHSSPASVSENKICNILNDTGSGDEGLGTEDPIGLAVRRPPVLPLEPSGKVVVDGIDLEEIREFARQFKIRRLSLGLTQSQVGQALTAAEGPAYSQSAICRFEKLDITPKSAQKIKPVLEKWMREAEQRYQEGMREAGGSNLAADLTKKRKRRTSFTPQALEVLNAHFEKNTHPSGAEMTTLAEQLKYDREVVRVWFCNKRQALKNTIKRLKSDRQFQPAVTSVPPLSRPPLPPPLPAPSLPPPHSQLPPPQLPPPQLPPPPPPKPQPQSPEPSPQLPPPHLPPQLPQPILQQPPPTALSLSIPPITTATCALSLALDAAVKARTSEGNSALRPEPQLEPETALAAEALTLPAKAEAV